MSDQKVKNSNHIERQAGLMEKLSGHMVAVEKDHNLIPSLILAEGHMAVFKALKSSLPDSLTGDSFNDHDKAMISIALAEKGRPQEANDFRKLISDYSKVSSSDLFTLCRLTQSENDLYHIELTKRVKDDPNFRDQLAEKIEEYGGITWFLSPGGKHRNLDIIKTALSSPGTPLTFEITSRLKQFREHLTSKGKFESALWIIDNRDPTGIFRGLQAPYMPLLAMVSIFSEVDDNYQLGVLLGKMVDYANWLDESLDLNKDAVFENKYQEDFTIGQLIKASFQSRLDSVSAEFTKLSASPLQVAQYLSIMAFVNRRDGEYKVTPEDGVIKCGLACVDGYNKKMDDFLHKHAGEQRLTTSEFASVVDTDWKLKMVIGLVDGPVEINMSNGKVRRVDDELSI
jgi:hypothetical protein